MKQKNPLIGKAFFDPDGNLFIRKNIKFGGQLNPKVKPREWFYLIFAGCSGDIPDRVKDNLLGSRVTRWRIKKSLIAKGYL